MGNLVCQKCQRSMAETNFYQYKDGTKCELCKGCLTMHVNNWEPDTFLWILEKFDLPWIPAEWNSIRDKAYQKDPYKMTGMSVIGRYISKMKLKQFTKDGKNHWADTEWWAEKARKEAEIHGTTEEQRKQQIEDMEAAYERGEISEAQLLTYKEIAAPVPVPNPTIEPPGSFGAPQPAFEEIQLPDVSEQLTDEDKIYLALKWGKLYRPDEWVALEQKYEDFMNSFDIQGAARLDTLKHICKTSLKMDQAIDCGDTDTYQKLSRVYDVLMKSGKFTEAQRKEEKSGDFDAVGQIVFFAEKEGGKIPRYEINTPLDKIDEAILDLKKYTHDLIVNDSGLSQMLENYIKRRESLADQKEDERAAAAEGLDHVQLDDQDYEEFNRLLQEGKEDEEE